MFAYDGVSRLVRRTPEFGFPETSAYDVFGNRIAAETEGVGWQTIPTDPSTNRLLGTPERPVAYDIRGNQTQWGDALYSYDGFDQMAIHEDLNSGLDQSFIYTADDERIVVIENDAPSETWYLRDLNGQVLRKYFRETGETTWLKDTIHRQGQVLATDTGGSIRHAHLDHLGTIRLWTRGGGVNDGTVQSRHNYTAFGEEILDQPTGEDFRYTGHERDIARSGACFSNTGVNGQILEDGESFTACADLVSNNTLVDSPNRVTFRAGDMVRLGNGFTIANGANFAAEIDGMLNSNLQDLDYMHARHCSPVQGRFLTVDPAKASADPFLPQSWNRYSYVQNKPMSFIDPTGEILFFFGLRGDLDELQTQANDGLFGVDLVVDDAGVSSLVSNGEVGPPTATQAAFAGVLQEAISSTSNIGLTVTNSGPSAVVGNALGEIDVADVAALSGTAGGTAARIAHEVAEQTHLQTRSPRPSTYNLRTDEDRPSHLAGIAAQSAVTGLPRVRLDRLRLGSHGVVSTRFGHGKAGETVTFIYLNGNIVKVFK